MDFISTFPHKGNLYALYSFKDVLLFPNAGASLYPRNKGIYKISEEDLIKNIKLTIGLARKNRAGYLKRNKI